MIELTETELSQKWLKNILSTEPANFELVAEAMCELYDICGGNTMTIANFSGLSPLVLSNKKIDKPLWLTASSPLMTVAKGVMGYFFIEAIRHNKKEFEKFNNAESIGKIVDCLFDKELLSTNDTNKFKIGFDNTEYSSPFLTNGNIYEDWIQDATKRIDKAFVTDILTRVYNHIFGDFSLKQDENISELFELTVQEEIKFKDLWSTYFSDIITYFNLRHPGKYGSAYSQYSDYKKYVLKEELPENKAENAYRKIVENSSVVWMAKNIFVICDREQELHVDSETNPHNENGPAIVYRDGIKKWYIHGIKLNEKIIMRPHEIMLEEIQNENDEDKRKIMIERSKIKLN